MIPCAANNSLRVTRDNDGNISKWECFLCDRTAPPTSVLLDSKRCQTVCSDAVAIFAKLIKSQAFVEARRPRILAMVALKGYTAHFNNAEFMDLITSPLGQWCVVSLKSSSRELRISAGRTLAGFVSNTTISEELIHRNREMVLELLRSISDKDQIHLQETWILTWGQIGRVLNDDGLGLVLLRLVEFLGHANPVISAVAFNEITKLAKAKNMTSERLFNPFWDDVAIAAVRGLLVRPQTTQLMADILGTSVTEFLLLTQSSTLPHLVLSGQIDVIARITQARGDDEAFRTCMEPTNFASILALLIVQNIPDIEALTTSLLRAVSPRFKDMDFTDWMRTDPAVLGLRLLKLAGQAPDSTKSRVSIPECVNVRSLIHSRFIWPSNFWPLLPHPVLRRKKTLLGHFFHNIS
jgi:serine/threonine-protein kinase ATR